MLLRHQAYIPSPGYSSIVIEIYQAVIMSSILMSLTPWAEEIPAHLPEPGFPALVRIFCEASSLSSH